MPPLPPPPEALLRHDAFVRALARELIDEPADREDAVQETWLIASRRPPRSAETARAWLRRVVQRVAAHGRRSGQRRRDRERRVPMPGTEPPAADTVARLELQREVIEATLALPEKYRAPLLLRCVDGLSVREVAERLGLPDRTVETQLRRARLRLRRQLEPRHGREGLAALGGGLLVATQSKLHLTVAGILIVLLALGTAGFVWHSRSGTTAKESAERADAEQVVTGAEAPPALAASVLHAERELEPSSTSPAGKWILRGSLQGLDAQAPWTSPVELIAWFDTLQAERRLAPRSGLDPVRAEVSVDGPTGHFDADLSPWFSASERPARVEVLLDDPRYVAVSRTLVPPGDAARDAGGALLWTIEIPLQLAAVVRGRVIDERGAPVARASVGLVAGVGALEESVRTDEQGRYRLRSSSAGSVTLVAAFGTGERSYGHAEPAPRGCLPVAERVSVHPGTEIEAPALVLASGASIEGRVLSEVGSPVPGALVVAQPVTEKASAGASLWLAPHRLQLAGKQVRARQVLAVSDETGAFRLEGLDPQSSYLVELKFVRHRLVAPSPARDPILPPQTGVELSAGIPVEIVVRDADGGRVPDARGHATFRSEAGMQFWNLSVDDLLWDAGQPATWVRPEHEVEISVRAAGHRPASTSFRLPHGTPSHQVEFDLDPDPPPRSLVRVRLTDGQGRPIRRAGFQTDTGWSQGMAAMLGDEGGCYELADLPPGPATLIVRGGGSSFAGEGLFVEDRVAIEVPAAGEIELSRRLHAGGRLRLQAVDATDRGLPAEVRLFDESGEHVPIELFTRTETEGRLAGVGRHQELSPSALTSVDPCLEPGRYDLELRLEGYHDRIVPIEIEAGRTLELSKIRMERR